MDSNFRYRGWKVLNLFPYERSCAHPLVWLFLQRLQPAQLSFIDLLQGVIRLGLWHVWVLLALGLRLSQLLIVTQIPAVRSANASIRASARSGDLTPRFLIF